MSEGIGKMFQSPMQPSVEDEYKSPKSIHTKKSPRRVSYLTVLSSANCKAVCGRFPIIFLVLIVLPILGLIVLGICYGLAKPHCNDILGSQYNYPLDYDRTLPIANNNDTYNIVLFGDSLIRYPFDELELTNKMRAYLPDFKLNIENYGIDSDVISDMRARVNQMLTATK